MSFRSLVVVAFAGVLMLSSAGAMAQTHGGGGGHGGGYHGGGYHGGGWGGRSSVFIGSDFGFWPYGYGYDYAPDYYAYPPPVVYAPPPPQAYYAPPAVGYVPQPGAAQAPVAANQPGTQAIDQSYCRQYQGTVVVDGATQPSSGVACKQPNGSWRIVQ